MATQFLDSAQRSASRGTIDLPLAILAGFAAGFVAFAMPADLLEGTVAASGLPSILAAAQPPLGTTARAAVSGAAALGAFTAVFLLMRMLGRERPAPRRAEPELELDVEPETPRLRRSAIHPDAPARRPILAARDLGEPAPAPAPEPAPPAAVEPPPFWRPEDFPPEPEDEIIEAEAAVDATLDLDVREPEPEPEAEITLPPPAEPVEESSIPDLMARLERGLSRRLQQKGVFPAPAAPAAPAVEAEATPAPAQIEAQGDDRLRSAIENLQRIAGRAG